MKLFSVFSTESLFSFSSFLACAVASDAALPAYPLAVRSPYLSTWIGGKGAQDVTTAQPFFWHGQSLQWSILARVDGTAWNLFGAPNGVQNAQNAKQVAISYTATHTLVNLTTANVDFSLDFFSPVSPHDYNRQSLPFSYLTVSATPHSGQPSVQILNAIDDSWTAQQGLSKPNISTGNDTTFFTFYNPQQYLFSEKDDMATYGSVLFGAPNGGNKVTWGSGSHNSVNQGFILNGALNGSDLSSYASGDLTALVQDLGKVSSTKDATFAVGLHRTNVINYLGNSMTGYSSAKYPNGPSALSAFIADYAAALKESQSLDNLVLSKGKGFSGNYSDILEATVRQIFGATEVVISAQTKDTNKPMVFLKEISSDGNIQTIDVIYPTSPALGLLAPEYLRLLLQPHLDYFQTNAWTQPYVTHDLGKHYPNATGYNGTAWETIENMPLQVTGQFFMLAQQYQQYSGNTDWIKPYISTLRPYADYLAKNGKNPASQLSTVDALCSCSNQTQLAVTSAVGLSAFAKLSGMSNYSTAAQSLASYITQPGVGLSTDRTHMTYLYGKDDTWGAEFPLFSDVQLGLKTFNQSLLDLQAAWYTKQEQPLGMPYAVDGEQQIPWTVTDWTMFAAGAATSKSFQTFAVDSGHRVLTGGYNAVPFPTKYNVEGSNLGTFIVNKARPTIGSYFSLLWQDKAWTW